MSELLGYYCSSIEAVADNIIIKTIMQVKKARQNMPIRYVKGVGPKRASLFERLGIYGIEDLFYYLPRRYEDRSQIVSVSQARPGETLAVVGTVRSMNLFPLPRERLFSSWKWPKATGGYSLSGITSLI